MAEAMSLIALLIVGWMVQIYLTYRQSRAFMRKMRRLRNRGTAGIGASSTSRYKKRTYVALTAGDDGVVREGWRLGGLSVFARPEQTTEFDGWRIQALAKRGKADDKSVPPDERAAAMAAQTILSALKKRERQEAGETERADGDAEAGDRHHVEAGAVEAGAGGDGDADPGRWDGPRMG